MGSYSALLSRWARGIGQSWGQCVYVGVRRWAGCGRWTACGLSGWPVPRQGNDLYVSSSLHLGKGGDIRVTSTHPPPTLPAVSLWVRGSGAAGRWEWSLRSWDENCMCSPRVVSELGPGLRGPQGTPGREPPPTQLIGSCGSSPSFSQGLASPTPFPPVSPSVSCMGEGMRKVGIEASSPPGLGVRGGNGEMRAK